MFAEVTSLICDSGKFAKRWMLPLVWIRKDTVLTSAFMPAIIEIYQRRTDFETQRT